MTAAPYRNLLDPDLFVPQNRHHEAMRDIVQAGGPVVKIDDPITGVPYWAVLGRDEVDYICKRPELFSSEIRTAAPIEMSDEQIAEQRLMVLNMDPPKHQKYRRITRAAFTPHAVDAYTGRFRKYARQIVDSVAARGECEFVTEVAAELPLMAILELCGIPFEDRRQFFDWTNAMFFREDDSMSVGDSYQAAAEAGFQVYQYAARLAEQHRQQPVDNIVGALLDARVGGEALTPEEFSAFFLLLIAAGNESTRTVTTHGMRLLIEHPDQLQLLVEQPELIPLACEEMLRCSAAFLCHRRTATADTEIAGHQIRKGDKVVLFWQGVNQDERVFDDPLAFDIRRYQRMPDLYREHRAFGFGQHFCLGAHLARLELRVMFEEIIPRLRNPRLAGPVQYVRDYFVNGIKAMPVRFDPETSAPRQ